MTESTAANVATKSEQTRAHDAVRQLRHRLTALGLPPDQIRQIVPVSDIDRHAYVRMGTLTVASAEKLLDALTRTAETVS